MGIYLDPFYIRVFVLIKHQASCGWGLPLLPLVTNSMGQWPSQGLVGTDMLLLINSASFPALWNLFLILLAFFPALLKALPLVRWSHCIPNMKGTSVSQMCNYIKWNNNNNNKKGNLSLQWRCVFSVHCNLGHKEEDCFLLPPPFPSKPRVSLGQGKMELAALRTMLGAVASGQEKAAPVLVLPAEVCLHCLCGCLISGRAIGLYACSGGAFREGSADPGMKMSRPPGTNEMQPVSNRI